MDGTDGSPQASERKGTNATAGNVANLVKRISTELQSKSDVPPVRPGASEVKQRRVKASFSYTPQNEDELRLEVDDVVEVLGEEEEGWWKGRSKNRVGVFPANFVKPLDASPRSDGEEKAKVEEQGDAPVAAASSAEIQPKKVAGIGFGNIFASNQKIELRTSNLKPNIGMSSGAGAALGSEKDKAPGVTGKKPLPCPSSSSAETSSGLKQKEYAKALFAYDAENEDELSLQEGDIIVVLAKDVEDAGWWLGETNGKKGVFPDNFVTQITAEEAELMKKPSVAVSTSPVVPPSVPAKPPKLAPTSAVPEHGKTMSLLGDLKNLPKFMAEGHGKAESHSVDKGTSSGAVTSDKEKTNVFRKPLVPLVGMPKLPKLGGGRFGASSPSMDEKVTHNDGQSNGVSASDSDKLNHPTAARARHPNRRPPSQAFLKDMAVEPALTRSAISTAFYEPPILPHSASVSSSNFHGINTSKHQLESGVGDGFVRREEFDELQAAFETFRRETRERIKEMEKLILASRSGKS